MRDDNQLGEPIDDGGEDLVIRRVARELQAPVTFGAGFDARVMAAVRAAAADDVVERRVAEAEATGFAQRPIAPAHPIGDRRGARGAWAWVVRPRTLRVSPLAGLAAAAALAFVMVQLAQQPHAPGIVEGPVPAPIAPTPIVPVANQEVQQVQFVLVAPSAKSVALVGDFNDWSATATPLVPVREGGVWSITVPLAPGRYTYNFVVDGARVMPDPTAPRAPADDFGTPASIVTVAGAQS